MRPRKYRIQAILANRQRTGGYVTMAVTHPTRRYGVVALALVGLGFLWGAGFPAIDLVVAELPPLGAAGFRYGVSGAIVMGYATIRADRVWPQTRREVLSIAVVGGFMFAGFQGGLFLGTQYISGAVASVVITMSPVVAALVAVPILGESRGLLDVGGFGLGVVGVLVLSQPTVGGTLSATTLGVGLVFLGTAMFALGSVTVQVFDTGLPLESLQAWAMLVGAGLLIAGAVGRGESLPALQSLSPVTLGALLYITLVAGAGGYIVYFQLVRQVGATETTLVAYLEPVAATLVSMVALGQSIGATTILGFLTVAAGFTIVSRGAMRRVLTGIRTSESPTPSSHQQRCD